MSKMNSTKYKTKKRVGKINKRIASHNPIATVAPAPAPLTAVPATRAATTIPQRMAKTRSKQTTIPQPIEKELDLVVEVF
jgi:hypothetical protein